MELVWDDRNNIGIEHIDAQHQELYSIVNSLGAAIARGQAKEIIKNTLSQLTDYAQAHFDAEEELMRKYEYPMLENHKREHDKFRQRIIEPILRLESGKSIVVVDTFTYIRQWILNHETGDAQNADPAMGKYLLDHPDSYLEYIPTYERFDD
jgi:hemerythrin-like metal-binding protein